ncbi:nmda receptor glutamate-binding chain [Cystoisospora suis]|uniref:Nmda receptor glutamate-binding chain n=1 Tax=Cystoisospora suis TaxID=483139 RepID=A0A2C6KM44_9APIC|nr:nmda receptor glutamate-binding chain [Cystoisospora suis]
MDGIKREPSVATTIGVGGSVPPPPAAAGGVASSSSFYDPEIGRSAQEELEDKIFTKEIRQGFIRKVYGIIALQLLMTTAVSAVFLFVDPIRVWMHLHGQPVIITAAILMLVTSIPLLCCQAASRRFPWNYLLLFFFTLAESVLVGSITSFYSEKTVLIAVGGTAVITIGLSLFACQSRYDFTSCLGILFVLTLNLMIFGFLCMLLPKWAHILYSSLALLLFSVYLVVDTQLVVGRGKLRLSEDDYIVAAMMIYVDVITIFLQLLRLVAAVTDNN